MLKIETKLLRTFHWNGFHKTDGFSVSPSSTFIFGRWRKSNA